MTNNYPAYIILIIETIRLFLKKVILNLERKVLKKTILIDLDGVLNTYSGKFDEKVIPKPKTGVDDFLQELNKTFKIKIFTTRNKILVAKWLIENKLDCFIDDITNVKELCWLYIDDRCISFDGNYEILSKEIKNFQPWYKK